MSEFNIKIKALRDALNDWEPPIRIISPPPKAARDISTTIVHTLGITREMAESVAMMARYPTSYKDGARIFAAADALTALLDLAEAKP